jgi:propanol-preferring alcohol dehydrogenase
MAEQLGYRVHAWGADPVWESFAIPTPGDDEVLVEVEACGVGLTVLNAIRGDLADERALLPRVPGHELVGRVIDAGPGEGYRLIGRRVVAYFYLSCGRCPRCLAGAEPRCDALAGWIGVHRDGGYAPWTVLPALNAMPIPDALDPVAATVVPDAVATAVHVCGRRGAIEAGERVVVVGAGGGVGIHVVQVARLCGADVIGLETDAGKRGALEALGVHAADPGDAGEPAPDVVIDLVGTRATLAWATDALGPGGRLVVVTTFREVTAVVEPRRLVLGELAILGSKYASRAEVDEATELVVSGRVEPVIGRIVAPPEVAELHAALGAGTLLGRGAIRW